MIKKTVLIAALVSTVALGGCAERFSCAGWDKARPSRHDTEGTKAWSLKHNDFGRRQGCWK